MLPSTCSSMNQIPPVITMGWTWLKKMIWQKNTTSIFNQGFAARSRLSCNPLISELCGDQHCTVQINPYWKPTDMIHIIFILCDCSRSNTTWYNMIHIMGYSSSLYLLALRGYGLTFDAITITHIINSSPTNAHIHTHCHYHLCSLLDSIKKLWSSLH